MHNVAAIALVGPGGEPVSFRRTIMSHGCASLAPSRVDEEAGTLETTLRIEDRRYALHVSGENGTMHVSSTTKPSAKHAGTIEIAIRRMFRLEQNLAPFYERIAGDPVLSWATAGAGRLMASHTVFEDIVKTICTTNCAWSATVRMTNALVQLGDGAFPTAETIARTPDAWFRDVARMGYRGPYIRTIANDVLAGALDLDGLLSGTSLSDDDVEQALLRLPGVGPYAAAHIMQLIGRHRRLVLDSWTRPTYLRLAKKKRATDTTIRRAFARYGEYAGLAFWLFLTREWVADHTITA